MALLLIDCLEEHATILLSLKVFFALNTSQWGLLSQPPAKPYRIILNMNLLHDQVWFTRLRLLHVLDQVAHHLDLLLVRENCMPFGDLWGRS